MGQEDQALELTRLARSNLWWRAAIKQSDDREIVIGIDSIDGSSSIDLAKSGDLVWIAGAPEAGKSWLALMLAKDTASRGGPVIYIDEEMSYRTWWERLALCDAIGYADAETLFDGRGIGYAQFEASPEIEEIEDLEEYERARDEELELYKTAIRGIVKEATDLGRPSLVIVDSATATGCPRDTGESITEWKSQYVDPFTRDGAAVVVVDHTIKSSWNGNRAPSMDAAVGTGDKAAQCDLMIGVTVGARGKWGRDRGGSSEISLIKDRHDTTRSPTGRVIAILERDDPDPDIDGDFPTLRLRRTMPGETLRTGNDEKGGDDRQADIDAVIEIVKASPDGITGDGIRRSTGLSDRRARSAIADASAVGSIRRSAGARSPWIIGDGATGDDERGDDAIPNE